MTRLRQSGALALYLCFAFGLAGCDDSGPPRNPFDPPPDAPKKPPPVTEVPKPKGPPELVIDNLSPKVGFSRVILNRPEDRDKLRKEVESVRDEFSGKETVVRVDRNTNPAWTIAMLEELGRIGASPIIVRTETRKEFPQELAIIPQPQAPAVASCSVVAMVLPDRGTAVWRLSGGTAGKRGKGLAGPDLSMTAETLERYGKGCKQSTALFVSGSEGIEWGLVYDLAASATRLEKFEYKPIILLSETPVAGRPVPLTK